MEMITPYCIKAVILYIFFLGKLYQTFKPNFLISTRTQNIGFFWALHGLGHKGLAY